MDTLRCSTSLPVLRASLCVAACGLFACVQADEPRTAPQAGMRLPGWIETLPQQAGEVVTASGTDAPTRIKPVADWAETTPVAGGAPAQPRPAAATPKPTPTQTEGGFRRWFNDRVASLPKPATLTPAAKQADTEAATPADGGTARPATVTAPVAATPDEMPTLSIDPASFRGVHPGKTTRAEVEKSWGPGEAFTQDDGTAGLAWKIEPFERVEMALDKDTVTSISIKLAEPVAVADLARQLEIADLRTVSVLDEQGAVIGEVYPERGVILAVSAGTTNANAILIEPLDADSFVLRAEREMSTCSAYAVADLQYAVQVDPRHVRARRLLLAMASEQGKWQQALQLATAAVELDPADVWTRLKHAGVLVALDRPQDARVIVTEVKAGDANSPLVVAQCERLLGRIALAEAEPDYQQAVEHFAEAIRRAAPLLTKRSPSVQAAASEVLLDAHLGTALAIARGTWQQKGRVIPKWVARSEAVVRDFKGADDERCVLELQLCRGALAVAAGSAEAIEPLPWVKRMLELRDRLAGAVSDPWRRRQIDWEVGLALADAMTAAQQRGDASDAIDNATLTAAFLERGAEQRELTAVERQRMGELMFRIGILHSLQRGDHATAVTWFDRALPLWEQDDPLTRSGELGRLGESYVSMAISYWQVERREDALELSRRGVELMVAAVDRKQLEERALAVAYGNLSTMYAEQGDEQQSRNYAEMANRAESTGTTVR